MFFNNYIIYRILYLLEDISELIGEIQLKKLPTGNETISIIIPCGYFTRGGVYILRIEHIYENSTVPITNFHQVFFNLFMCIIYFHEYNFVFNIYLFNILLLYLFTVFTIKNTLIIIFIN